MAATNCLLLGQGSIYTFFPKLDLSVSYGPALLAWVLLSPAVEQIRNFLGAGLQAFANVASHVMRDCER
jgi:hypothetical protein